MEGTGRLEGAFELKALDAAGGFEGYASVFDVVDQGRDVILKGAFLRSLKERGAAGIRLLWQHDPKEPIGVIDDLREDGRGLYVRGRLLLDVARAKEAYALMKAGALDGLSIGFHAVAADMDERSGVRFLKDLDLWEISLVTFPMQDLARVTHFKERPSLRDFETFLREAGGFSRGEAKGLAARGYKALQREAGGAGEGDWAAVIAALQDAASILTI
jgi:HK97 family phage prohead protease